MTQSKPWVRHRFRANHDDPRPVTFPPPGPWWCTGYGSDYAIVVAYLPPDVEVRTLWPEASEITSEPRDEIVFTDRLAKPDWWPSSVPTAQEGK